MRGQATPIQHLHQRGQSPNNKNASDKLPSYLQSLHQFRPTKPSHGFSETGLGRLKPNGLKTPGSFQTYLLFTMYPKQAPSSLSTKVQTFISPEGYSIPSINPPIQTVRSSPIVWRAVRSEAIVDRDSVRTKLRTIALAIGGAERDRTADPLLAKQVLSQLSYSPNHRKHPTA